MDLQEAIARWQADRARFERIGIHLQPSVRAYQPDGWAQDINLAMDAMPTLQTDPNSGIPAFLSTTIDPEIFQILFAANKGAAIFGEALRGTWVSKTEMFLTVEHTGETSSYSDFADSGKVDMNMNFPQRQSYNFQTLKEYGDMQIEAVGLAKINYVNEVDKSAATTMGKFHNTTYFFGVQGIQNYGILNEPNLTAAINPAPKTGGGTAWFNGTVLVASANEVYNDIVSLFALLVSQTNGLVDQESKMKLALSPSSSVALTATNSFNVNVRDLLKKNFPNLEIETAVQYGAVSASNPQGNQAGNLVQLIADNIEGQKTGFCAYNHKMRAFPIVRGTSSYRQKISGGSWGFVLRMPIGIAQMVGV